MNLELLSWIHCVYIAIAAGVVTGLYFLLRRLSLRVQKCIILSIMLVNVLQHLFKMYIYPQYDGGFNALSGAYNFCALMILISPIIYLLNIKVLKSFLFYFGSAAGSVAILIPYWNIGKAAFSWEIFRFLLCHILLLASSLLPLLLGHHRPSWKFAPAAGIAFLFAVILIVFNDMVFIYMGLYPGLDGIPDLYDALAAANPVWSFGPPESFAFMLDIARALSPDIIVNAVRGGCVPVLWYAIPVYIGITLLAFPVCILVDFKNFKQDMAKYKEKIVQLTLKIKRRK